MMAAITILRKNHLSSVEKAEIMTDDNTITIKMHPKDGGNIKVREFCKIVDGVQDTLNLIADAQGVNRKHVVLSLKEFKKVPEKR